MQRPSKKWVAERLVKITMVQLRKNGFLQPGEHTGGVAWPDGAVRVKLATTIAGPDGDYLNLIYTTQSGVGYDAWIPISTTRCHYGGVRGWFMCPTCNPTRRVTVLYFNGERFVCRLCCAVTYTTRLKPFANVSYLDIYDPPPYLLYRGQPTRRSRRRDRMLKKAKVLEDRQDRLRERQDKRLGKLKDECNKKFARIITNRSSQTSNPNGGNGHDKAFDQGT